MSLSTKTLIAFMVGCIIGSVIEWLVLAAIAVLIYVIGSAIIGAVLSILDEGRE